MKWLENKLAEIEAWLVNFHARCDAAVASFEAAKTKVATIEAATASDGGPVPPPPPPNP